MSSDEETFELAALLSEMAWLQRLAASLVGGAERGGDVAQDALLAAIERWPAVHGDGTLRPWLAAVARKLVLRGARREANRAAVERDHAKAESAPSTADAAERVELSRRLAEALLALEEPYRSAVIWRHHDCLSAQQIAERQHTSLAAARQRVSRGLAMLRERLDRSLGGREAWCAALALRFDLSTAVGTGAAPAGSVATAGLAGRMTGAWLMSARSVATIAASALLAIVTWIAVRAAPEAADEQDRPFAVSEGVSTPHRVEEPTTPTGESRDRRSLGSVERIVSGIVRNKRGEPVAGATVHLAVNGRALSSVPARGTETGEGRLTGIRGSTKGFAPTSRALDEPLVEDGRLQVDLVLEEGATARGMVVDARTREPIPGATVFAELRKLEPKYRDRPWIVADEQGRFELVGIDIAHVLESNQNSIGSPSGVPIGAEASGHAIGHGMLFPDRIGQVFENVEILLEPAAAIVCGLLLTAEREPAVGTEVLFFDAARNGDGIRVGSDGRFRFEGVPEGSFTVFATDCDSLPEPGGWASHYGHVQADEVRELELVLAPPAGAIEGRVTDRFDAPIPGERVSLDWSVKTADSTWHIGTVEVHAVTDDTGHYRLEHLFPGQYSLIPDFANPEDLTDMQVVLASPMIVRLDASEHISNVDLVVAEPVEVRGRVAGRESEAGWDIELRRAPDGRVVARTRTNAEGSFHLRDLFPADFDLVVLEEGREIARVAVGPEGARDLVLNVP